MQFDRATIENALKNAGWTVTAAGDGLTAGRPSDLSIGDLGQLFQSAFGAAAGQIPDLMPEPLKTGTVAVSDFAVSGLGSAAIGQKSQKVVHFPLDGMEGTGANRTLEDQSGNKIKATIEGNPRVVVDGIAEMPINCALFQLGGDAIVIPKAWAEKHPPNAGGTFAPGHFSVCLWVKPAGTKATCIASCYGPDGGGHAGWMMSHREGKIEFVVGNGPRTWTIKSDQAIPTGQWTHVSAVFEAGQLTLYVNDKTSGSATVSGSGAQHFTRFTPVPLRLGKEAPGLSFARPYQGRLYNLRIYGKAIDATEVANIIGTDNSLGPDVPEAGPRMSLKAAWKGASWKLVPGWFEVQDPELALTATPGGVGGVLSDPIQLHGADFLLETELESLQTIVRQRKGEHDANYPNISVQPLFKELGVHEACLDRAQLTNVEAMVNPRERAFMLRADLVDALEVGPLKAEEVKFEVSHEEGGNAGSASARVTLDVSPKITLAVQGGHSGPGNGWTFDGEATLEGGAQVPISSLVQLVGGLFGGAPSVPVDLSAGKIERLKLHMNTNGLYRFELDTTAGDATLVLRKAGNAWNKQFEVEFKIGDAAFDVVTEQVGGKTVVKGTWKEADGGSVDLHDFFAYLGISTDKFPDALDVSARQASFRWDKTDHRFACDLTTGGGKTGFFVARKITGWQGAGGVVTPLVELKSALGNLDPFSQLGVPIQDAALILSSLDLKVKQMPPLPNFAQGSLPLLGAQPLHLKKGLTLVADFDLKAAGGSHAFLKPLHTLAGKDRLLLGAELSATPSFFASLGATLDFPPPKEKSLISLQDPELEFGLKPPEVKMQGAFQFHIPHETLTALANVAITANAVEGAFMVTASSAQGEPRSLPVPMGLKGVKLDELGGEIGMVVAPPGVNVGVTGRFHIGEQRIGANEFTIVLLIIPGEPIPDPLMLSIFIEQLTVETAIIAVQGKPDPSVPKFLQDIKAENLWLYWCQEPVMLPDGTFAQPGFGFNGFLDVLGWQAHACLLASPENGVSGEAQMEAINLQDVVKIGGKSTPPVKMLMEQVNGQWVPVRRQSTELSKDGDRYKSAPAPGAQEREVIPAGGALLKINSKHSPYAEAIVDAELFGQLSTDVHLEVTGGGGSLEVHLGVGSDASMTLKGTIKESGFQGEADFQVHLDADFDIDILGQSFEVDLDSSIDLEMGLKITGDSFSMKLDGSFEYDGFDLTMPTLHIGTRFTDLEELPGKIGEHIKDNAEEIFKDVFGEVVKLLKQGAEEVKKIAEAGAKEVGKIGAEAVEQAGKIADDAKKVAEASTQELENAAQATAQEVAKLSSEAKEEAEKIGREAVAKAEEIASQIGPAVQQGLEDVKHIAESIEKEFKQIGEDITRIAGEATEEVEKIAKAAAATVKQIGEEAEEAFKDVISDAHEAAKAIASKAEDIVNSVGDKAEEAIDHVKFW